MKNRISIADWIGIYGAVLATAIAIGGGLKSCREQRAVQEERSKLVVSMNHLTLNLTDKKKTYHMAPLVVANLGRESVILTQAVARGDGWSSHSGWYKEPEIAYGIQEQILPKELKPGESCELRVFLLAMFRRQKVEEVVVIDADENEYHVSRYDLDRLKREADEVFKDLIPEPNSTQSK